MTIQVRPKSKENQIDINKLLSTAMWMIPMMRGAKGVGQVGKALLGRFGGKQGKALSSLFENVGAKKAAKDTIVKDAFVNRGMVRPNSANVRAIQATPEGVYVLFSGGDTYKYRPEMADEIFATLGKPFAAKTTGKNAFKSWFKGSPSAGGSFHQMISKNKSPETYTKTFTAPREMMRAKLVDALIRARWSLRKGGK